MTEQERQDIAEIKKMLSMICNQLGIGKVPPAKVIDLKARAKRRAIEIQRKSV